MANLSELIRQKEQQTEEWKQRKADERDSLNEMNDAAALRVTESTGAFLHYLDVQADNPRFSASNVLLAMEQNPEVTVFNSVKGWNGLNRNVMREEVGMKIRVGDTYVRDGRQYRGYKVGRVFDISQTTGRGQPAKSQLTDEAMVASEGMAEQFVDKDLQLARLQNEVLYLRQQLEFIKKIIKADNSSRRKL